MHKKYITPSQRVITCVLLFSQLLTSCGGYETLLPSNPNAHPKKTVREHETTCPDDNQLELDTQPATFIDGTPLKLGQKEIQFVWNKEQGLQAFTIDPSMGSMATYVPIGIPTAINPGNGGKKIVLAQLNPEQTEAVVKNFKWEVTKEGELKERGGRLRGGMESQSQSQSQSKSQSQSQSSKWTPSLRPAHPKVTYPVQTRKASSQSIAGARVSVSGDAWRLKDSTNSPKSTTSKKAAQDQGDWLWQQSTGEWLWRDKATGELWWQDPNNEDWWKKDKETEEWLWYDPKTKKLYEENKSTGESEKLFVKKCFDPAQYEQYQEAVHAAVKDFFRDYLQSSPYLPNPTLEIAVEGEKPDDLQVVIASITFFDTEKNEITRVVIRSDKPVLNPYKELDINKKNINRYHEQIMDLFNESIASFLQDNHGILKRNSKIFNNPLLNAENEYPGTKIYDLIRKKIIEELQKKGTMDEGKDLDAAQESIILQSIISYSRHAEEALTEYLNSNEFDKKLKKLLNQKIKDIGEEEVIAGEGEDIDIRDQIQILKLNSIKIDCQSKESYAHSKVILRCVQKALRIKFFNKDVAAALAAADEEEEARAAAEEAAKKAKAVEEARKVAKKQPKVILRISSQQRCYDEHDTSVSEYDDISPIQYRPNPNLSSVPMASESEANKYTAFVGRQ